MVLACFCRYGVFGICGEEEQVGLFLFFVLFLLVDAKGLFLSFSDLGERLFDGRWSVSWCAMIISLVLRVFWGLLEGVLLWHACNNLLACQWNVGLGLPAACPL